MVSVFQLPNRLNFATDITFEDEFTWIYEQLQSADRDTEELLDFVLQIYNQIPKAVQHNPEMLEKAIRYDITNYLRDLQTRPPLMRTHRRFVVIGDEEESGGYPQIGWVCRLLRFVLNRTHAFYLFSANLRHSPLSKEETSCRTRPQHQQLQLRNWPQEVRHQMCKIQSKTQHRLHKNHRQ
jgi:hypothetical protein